MFKRDYSNLNTAEAAALAAFDAARLASKNKFRSISHESKLLSEFPAIEYNRSYFPNNHMSYHDLKIRKMEYRGKLHRFKKLIYDKKTNEQEILNYIKKEEAYFIIASIVKNYTDWGHHDLYVFREFPIGTQYRADFVISGKNSFGYHFLFVEFEGAYGSIINNNGDFGTTIRKGISQVEDWESFIVKNFAHLKPIFDSKKNNSRQLPDEFYEYDPVKISHCVVAGRRNDFCAKSSRKKHEQHGRDSKFKLLHYDNVIECTERLLRDGLF